MAIRDMQYRREFLGDFPSAEEEQVAFDRELERLEQRRQADYIRQNVQAMVSDFADQYPGQPRTHESLANIRAAVSNMLNGLQRQGMLPGGNCDVECSVGDGPGQVNINMSFPAPMPSIGLTWNPLSSVEAEIPKILSKSKIIQSSTPIEPEVKPMNRFKELLF